MPLLVEVICGRLVAMRDRHGLHWGEPCKNPCIFHLRNHALQHLHLPRASDSEHRHKKPPQQLDRAFPMPVLAARAGFMS